MKKTISAAFLIVIFFSVFSFLMIPSFASAQVNTPAPGWQGLVPCGRNSGTAEEKAPCTLCHFIVGFQRLVQYALYLVISMALVGVFFAGVMYIISAGDEGMMTTAKTFLKVSLTGFTIVITAWLIVNVTMWVLGAKEAGDQGGVLGIQIQSWNKFSCSAVSSAGTMGTGGGSGGGGVKYKCRIGGVCDPASDGIYNSKAECENSPTCKTSCSDYHLACNKTTPCCDTTQQCVQNPSLSEGKLWCAKVGEKSEDLGRIASCGNENLGYCYDGNWTSPCPKNQTWMGSGTSCPSGLYCCAQKGKQGALCGGAVGEKGMCQSVDSACSKGMINESDKYPQCESGLKCCKP